MLPSPLNQPYSRIRLRGALVKGAPLIDVASGPAANSTSVIGYGAAVGRSETMTDVVTPQFSAIMASGAVLFKPMTQALSEHQPSSTVVAVRQIAPAYMIGQTYTDSGDWVSYCMVGASPSANSIPGAMSPKSLIPASTADRAISEACTKALKFPSEANLLVSLAELHKTMRLVPDLWTNWAQFFQSFNSKVGYAYGKHLQANPIRQSKANLLALQKIVDQTWLAVRFGVRPLIMDTLGVMRSMETSLSPDPVRFPVRGSSAVSASEVTSWNYNVGITRNTIVSAHSHNLSVRAMSLLEIALDSYSRRIGTQLGNIPEAVIDLVSFSFVANWVITLNDYMSAIGRMAQPGMRTLGGCYVVTDQKSASHQITGCTCTNASFVLTSSPQGVNTVTVNSKYRAVGLRAPSLSIRADPFKFLTDLRLVDSIALLSVQGRRLRYAGLVR